MEDKCPNCNSTNVEEDREIPGLVYKVCAQCGTPLALYGEKRAPHYPAQSGHISRR